MDLFLLKILLPLVQFFGKKSIDFPKLKIIVETKLLMDRRRKPQSWKKSSLSSAKNPMLGTLILNMVVSLLIAIPIFFVDSVLLIGILLHTYLLLMIIMTLITDFSTILLDTTDNQIILPRPVNGQTLFMARLLHVCIYLLQFSMSLMLLPLIALFINFGWATGATAIFTTLLTTATAVFFTYLLYMLLVYFFKVEKIKTIVSYFQIVITIFIIGAYQILPRMISMETLNENFTLSKYAYILPPVWMAQFLDAVHNHNFSSLNLLMMTAAVLFPSITIWIIAKFLAPVFNKKIAGMGTSSEAVTIKQPFSLTTKSFSEKLSNILCVSNLQKATFEKVWNITARDRNFKLQFYPSLGYMIVLIFVTLFQKNDNPAEAFQSLATGKYYLLLIYMPLWMVYSSVYIIPYNDNYEASWFYKSAPIKHPGQIILGGLKALLVKFYLPFYLLFFLISLYIWGFSIMDDFIYGLLNSVLLFIIINLLGGLYIPFSLKPDLKKQAGKFIKVIFQSLVTGLLIGIHYFLLKIDYLILLAMPIVALGIVAVFNKLKKISWNKINF